MATKKSSLIIRRLLFSFGALFFLVLAAACLGLAFAPRIASSELVKKSIAGRMEESLGRSVRLKNIDWSWSEGITITGVGISGHPDFPGVDEFLSAERIHLEFSLRKLFARCLDFSLVLEDPSLNLVRNKKGELNIFRFPAQKKKKPAGKKKAGKRPSPEAFSLPMDISADMDLSGISVVFNDLARDKTYRIENMNVRVSAPSLAEDPAKVSVSAEAFAAGKKLPETLISLKAENIFGIDGRLSPESIKAGMEAALPGASMKISGSMKESGLKADISLELQKLVQAVSPFVPAEFKSACISGTLDLQAELSRSSAREIGFNARISGKGLSASGGFFKDRSLGPGDIGFSAEGGINLESMDLKISSARAELLQNSLVECRGRISGIGGKEPELEFNAAPVKLDIKELLSFGGEFLPAGIRIAGLQQGSAGIFIEKTSFKGRIPSGESEAEIKNARLRVSDFSLKTPAPSPAELSLKDLDLLVSEAEADLSGMFPEKAGLSASLKLGSLACSKGNTSLRLGRFFLKKAEISADGVSRAPASPFAVCAEIRVAEKAEIGSAEYNSLAAVSGFTQELMLSAELGPGGRVSGKVDKMRLEGKKIEILKSGVSLAALPAEMEMGLAEFSMDNAGNTGPDIRGLKADVKAGDVFSASLAAELREGGRKHFSAAGRADLNAAGAAEALPERITSGFRVQGKAGLDFSASGKLPGESNISGLKNLRLKDSLDFLENCSIRISLSGAGIEYPGSGNKPGLRIGSMSADPLISYSLEGGTGRGSLKSRINFSRASELLLARPKTPFSGRISLGIEHTGAEYISIDQDIRLEPGDVSQSMKLRLEGPEQVLSLSDPFEIFSSINGSAEAGFSVKDAKALAGSFQPEQKTVDAGGRLEAGLRVKKTPDNLVGLFVNFDAHRINARVKDKLRIDGLESSIKIEKTVKIEKNAEKDNKGEGRQGLSRRLLQPEEAAGSSIRLQNIHPGLSMKQIPGRREGDRIVSLDSAVFDAGGFPVSLGKSNLYLGFFQGLPQLKFDINVMDGTVAGSLSLARAEPGLNAGARINFTGINPSSFAAGGASGDSSRAREISGSMSAFFPLLADMQKILENAEISMNFREIGPRALERMLYAMDPNEENEAIVSQRKLLRMGSPRSVRLSIKEGLLSLEGEILVKSVPVSLPPVKRFNVAGIPGIKAYEPDLSAFRRALSALDTAASETLAVEDLTGTGGLMP